jgi:hypothetical protein
MNHTFLIFIKKNIFQFYDPANARYEVPIPLNNVPSKDIGTTEFDVIYPEQEGSLFSLQIVRKSTGTVLY